MSQPTLANGIADYGGSNNTISNNVVADDNALGSGIAISNEAFLQPFTPLSGTITVTGNYLIRAGAYNPNWGHPMGAVQFDAYDTAFSGVTVNYSGGAILDSPYEAFESSAAAATGNTVSGLNISNVNVQNVGTVVMQAETAGLGQRQRGDRQRRRGGRAPTTMATRPVHAGRSTPSTSAAATPAGAPPRCSPPSRTRCSRAR